MHAKTWSGVVLSDIPGTEKDVETICYDKPGVYLDGGERIHEAES